MGTILLPAVNVTYLVRTRGPEALGKFSPEPQKVGFQNSVQGSVSQTVSWNAAAIKMVRIQLILRRMKFFLEE